jgi:S1-C subfamily serine protease
MKKAFYLLTIFLLLLLMLSGCRAIKSSKVNRDFAALPKERQVVVYPSTQEINAATLIGSIVVRASNASIPSCGHDEALALARERAREMGGNAMTMYRHVDGVCCRFLSNVYWVDEQVDFGNVEVNEEELKAYFDKNVPEDADSIEGIWRDLRTDERVAIYEDKENPDRDYVGVIFSDNLLNLKKGDVKFKINYSNARDLFLVSALTEKRLEALGNLSLESPLQLLLRSSRAVNDKDYSVSYLRQYPGKTGFGIGTGFFVGEEGYIVTAYHVVEGVQKIMVTTSEGVEVEAELIKSLKQLDAALLKVDIKAPATLAVAKPGTVAVGNEVFTVGFPDPNSLGYEKKYNAGSISAMTGFEDEASTMQVSIPLHGGNSGGPVVNNSGEVVGIVQSKSLEENNQNLAWVLNTDYIQPILPFDKMGKLTPTSSHEEAIGRTKKAVVLIKVEGISKKKKIKIKKK